MLFRMYVKTLEYFQIDRVEDNGQAVAETGSEAGVADNRDASPMPSTSRPQALVDNLLNNLFY